MNTTGSRHMVDAGPAMRMSNALVERYGSVAAAAAIANIEPSTFLRVVRGTHPQVTRDVLRKLRNVIEGHVGQNPLRNAIIGSSRAIEAFRSQIDRLAPFPFTSVLFVGESGTGKSLGARYLHHHRSSGEPFIELNMAAMPISIVESELFGHEPGAFTGAIDRKPGLFEVAGKGVVFLDEVDSMPIEVQAKMLTALERRQARRVGGITEYEFEAGIIAAASERLYEHIDSGAFRRDLYYRLAVHTVRAPSLREHPEDIDEIVETTILEYHMDHGAPRPEVAPCAIDALKAHSWPGNVRELRSVVERLLTYRGAITGEAVVDAIDNMAHPPDSRFMEVDQLRTFVYPLGRSIEDLKRAYVLRTLGTSAKISQAARSLGVSKKTLWEWRKKYGEKK